MKRTFLPITNYPTYNDAVDTMMLDSSILNGGSDMINIHSISWDRKNIEYHLMEREGDEEGQFIHEGRKSMALIPFIELKIKAIEDSFKKYKIDQVHQGYAEPSEMPIKMLNEYYTLHASKTVLQAEADELRKRLNEYKDKEQKIDDSMVLAYGPRLFGKLLDGRLHTIDGQNVTEIGGTMVISDQRSPYYGLSVPDYRDLAIKWRMERKQGGVFAKAPSKIAKSSLPPFPENAKNYFDESSDESI